MGRHVNPDYTRPCDTCPPGTKLKDMCQTCIRHYRNVSSKNNQKRKRKENKTWRPEKRRCHDCGKLTMGYWCEKCREAHFAEGADEFGSPFNEYVLPW